MEKIYDPKKVEEKIYRFWEKGGWFTPKIPACRQAGIPKKKPFSILLPLPNANDPLHMGHALFSIQDIMIRYHRMLGEPALWLPGSDHAGIETQFVFEKQLAKEGKSRFDFDRETLYQMITEFVEKNRLINLSQLKRLGFSLDWTRYRYSLEPKIIKIILATFYKLHQDRLVYRGERIINYCPKCGTAFSDLEVRYKEQDDFLYYLDYDAVKIATTRPETIFADVAVAVHPKDKRYKKLVGLKATIPLINKKVPIITDEAIDVNFGTGALKITPAHDAVDFEVGLKNKLDKIIIIDRNGQMVNLPEKYLGLNISEARKKVVEDLKKEGKLIRTKPLRHTIGHCYRCGSVIEPTVMPQWFVKIKPLAKLAIEAVKKGKTKIIPKKRFEKMYFDWLENIRDWNISRQIVWGPRIPVWYCLGCNPQIIISFIDSQNRKITGEYRELKTSYSFAEIKKGLQALFSPTDASYSLDNKPCKKCYGKNILQETDTFDTWFLSGQWPLTTLGYPDSKDFKYFYPTSVLDTLWDILFFWVARMTMFGLYLAKDVPFKVIHLHCRVVDEKGQKMSKSKGNVIDPLEMVEKYGADALRMALVFGASPGSDICLSSDKVRAMRNFANKIWNATRFVLNNVPNTSEVEGPPSLARGDTSEVKHPGDKWILEETDKIVARMTNLLNRYRFDLAAEEIYQFFWHTFCDKYIEKYKVKSQSASWRTKFKSYPVLLFVLSTSLKLLHPFMPFITEEIWQLLPERNKKPLIISEWPK